MIHVDFSMTNKYLMAISTFTFKYAYKKVNDKLTLHFSKYTMFAMKWSVESDTLSH